MQTRSGIGRLGTPEATRTNYRRGVQRVIRALWDCEVPMVAAVNGHAIGLGLDIACVCDVRLAADTARFASSFVKIGIVPGDGGAWILARAIGLSRASEMILTGDTIDARTAESYGLVSRVVPAGQLLSEAHAVARRIAVNPPESVAAGQASAARRTATAAERRPRAVRSVPGAGARDEGSRGSRRGLPREARAAVHRAVSRARRGHFLILPVHSPRFRVHSSLAHTARLLVGLTTAA